MQMATLIYAAVLCYQTRLLPLEYSEGHWIFMCAACRWCEGAPSSSVGFERVAACSVHCRCAASAFQINMLGAPLLFLVADSPVAAFLTKTMIAFLPNASLLLLLFVPKIWALHEAGQMQETAHPNVAAVAPAPTAELSSVTNAPEANARRTTALKG